MESNLVKFVIFLPEEVVGWLEVRPPQFPAASALDVLLSLVPCLTDENNFDVETLVEVHTDYLIEFFYNYALESEHYSIEEYEDFFRGIYLEAQSLISKLSLEVSNREDDLIKYRLQTLAVTKDCRSALVVIDKRTKSPFYEGDYKYINYGSSI